MCVYDCVYGIELVRGLKEKEREGGERERERGGRERIVPLSIYSKTKATLSTARHVSYSFTICGWLRRESVSAY